MFLQTQCGHKTKRETEMVPNPLSAMEQACHPMSTPNMIGWIKQHSNMIVHAKVSTQFKFDTLIIPYIIIIIIRIAFKLLYIE